MTEAQGKGKGLAVGRAVVDLSVPVSRGASGALRELYFSGS